jgi:Manganese containing catalase
VRGGVHIVAYAKALEKLTGADVGRVLPIPDVSNKKFPEAMKHEANGLHTIMWKFSPEDYNELDQIWNGPHSEDGQYLVVRDEMPLVFLGRKIRRSRSFALLATSIQRCSTITRRRSSANCPPRNSRVYRGAGAKRLST